MSEKERLMKFIETYDGNFEGLIFGYMMQNEYDFPASRINKMIGKLNNDFLASKIDNNEAAISIAAEKASYIKCYLEGKMFATRKAAEKNVSMQINNAKAIIEAYNKSKGVE